jgi:hypothetical protein
MTELQRIEAELELDLEERTPYPLLCCLCQSRGDDWTDVDLALPRIFDSYSCHHPVVGKCKGTQETVRAWKDCQAFRRRVRNG